ncbi:hypothetical protein GCM10022221_10120 [Actinocorallia aurea]
MIPYTQPEPFHSQWGEDRWLAEHGVLPMTGTFVDVGAGDGRRGSNTLYWENLGWRGLCVDADPRNRQPLGSRNCRVVHCAVSARPGRRTFWMYGPRASLSGLEASSPDHRPVAVEARTLTALLDDAEIVGIDLLSVDVEGTELDVWRSFDAERHKPGIVLIEYDDKVPGRSTPVIRRALGPAYSLIHRTPSNLIFRHEEYP